MAELKKILKIVFLLPFMVIYRIIVWFRNFLYDNKILKSSEFDIPIISLGNISVGGTGKTPHTEFLIKMLKNEFQIAVLSRGYKRKTKGFRIVNENDSFLSTGDEPLQIKQKFNDVIVSVCENRVKGISILRSKFPDLNLIILDDAYQHRRVNPGLSILLNNYHQPISKDYMLPIGRLREPRNSTYRAHIMIYTKCPTNLKPIERRILLKEAEITPEQSLFFTSYKYFDLIPIDSNNNKIIPINNLINYNILLMSGIAQHTSFVNYFNTKAKSTIHFKFSDHYNFAKKDFIKVEKAFQQLAGPKLIIVTEKDAVKLKERNFFSEETKKLLYCVQIEVELLSSEEEKKQFDNQIFSYVRNNKRYSKLYKNLYS